MNELVLSQISSVESLYIKLCGGNTLYRHISMLKLNFDSANGLL